MSFEESFVSFMNSLANFIKDVTKNSEKKHLQKICPLVLENTIFIDNKSSVSVSIQKADKTSCSIYAMSKEDADSIDIKTESFESKSIVTITSSRNNLINVSLLIQIPSPIINLTYLVSNGNIKLENLNIGTLNIKQTNGNILCLGLEGNDYHIETINGKIKVGTSTFDKCELKTNNGNILVKGCGSLFDLCVHSNNGKVSIRDIVQGGSKKLTCTSDNGNIFVEN